MPGVIEKQIPARSLDQFWLASLDESVISINWSADGEWLAAASASGSIYLFEQATGRCLQQWSGHDFGATQVAWHPQGLLLATAGQDGKVCLWDMAGSAEPREFVRTLECGADWVEHIAWSASGQYLATAAGRKLKLWDREGTPVRSYPDHPHTIAAVAWKKDSDELVSACYGQLQFWSPEERRSHRTLEWKGSMLALAWSPDGRHLCHGNQDATVHFWVMKSGKELQMSGYPTKVRELSWDSSSRYLATGGGAAITVWDCSGKGPARTRPAELRYHGRPVSKLAYGRSGGVLASGCAQGVLAVWTAGKEPELEAASSLSGAIMDLVWSPKDDFLAAGTADGSLAVYAYP